MKRSVDCASLAMFYCSAEHREELALRGGLSLLYLAVQRTSVNRDVIEHAARCIANIAVNGSLALNFFELNDTA